VGALKMPDWKMLEWILADQIGRVENAGLEFGRPNSRVENAMLFGPPNSSPAFSVAPAVFISP